MATALEYLKECPVCQEEFTDPRVFPCDHSLCVDCIGHIRKGNTIKCPECNAVHDMDKVRRDFRLMQFLDALKEDRLKTSEKAPKQDNKPICDGCLSESATHWCKNCKQWLCNGCKDIHTRMASSKHHKLEPIAKKIEDFKNNYAHEIRSIKSVFEDSSVTIDEIEEHLKELKGNQIESLATSDALRKQAIKDIEEYFDSIDAKILSFIQEKMEKLETKKLELQTQFRESKIKWKSLERMINDNSRELLTEGEAMFEKVKNDQETKEVLDFEKEKVVIDVAKGASWDPITAATLSMRTVKESQAKVDASAKQPKQPGVSGSTYSSSKLSMTIVGKQHASDNVPGNLSALATTKFKEIANISCSGIEATALRVINKQLWSCQFRTIEIFNKNLELIKILQNEAWDHVCDVTVMPNVGIVIACYTGLLHIDDAGDTISEIDSGWFTSVDIYKGTLFGSECETESIHSYTYSDGGWIKQGSINLPRSGLNTISVKNNTITVCNDRSNMIDVLSMSGQQLYTYGSKGTEGAGEPRSLRLCQEDCEGALLVADEYNDRLQLLDKRRQWSIVDLSPELKYHQGAVYVDNTLYVHGSGGLWKYIAK